MKKQIHKYGADVHADNDYALRIASYYGYNDIIELKFIASWK